MAKEEERQKKREAPPHPGLKPLCRDRGTLTVTLRHHRWSLCCHPVVSGIVASRASSQRSCSSYWHLWQHTDANSGLHLSTFALFFQTWTCRWFKRLKWLTLKITYQLWGPADFALLKLAADTSSRSGSNTAGIEGSLDNKKYLWQYKS